MAPEDKSGDHQSSAGSILWKAWESELNCMAIYHKYVEIFQSGTKWWTKQQNDIAIPRGMLLAASSVGKSELKKGGN